MGNHLFNLKLTAIKLCRFSLLL